jgi:cell division protein FtsB
VAPSPQARRRVLLALWVVGGAAAAWFAVQGGEYGTVDLLRQRGQHARLDQEIDSLERVVDSLTALKRRVLTDPKTQERIAREEFGMIRGNELLYRFSDSPSSSPSRPDSP